MALQKLTEAHHRFILAEVAAFNISPSAIKRLLCKEETATQFGFTQVEVSHQRLSQVIIDLNDEDIASERAKFLADFSDTPLATQKMRVIELAKLYNRLSLIEGPDKGTMLIMLQSLRDIKAEIGEDAKMLADALRASGGTTIHVDLSDHQRQEIAYVIMPQPTNGGDGPVVPGPTNGEAAS